MAESNVPGKRWKIGHIVVVGISSLIVLGVCILLIAASSQKEGIEFCPDDFTQREFSYAKVGWLNWTVRGITYQNTTTRFQQSLVTNGWIKLSGRTPKVWHLVGDSVSNPNSPDFDSRILISYLESDYWEGWSNDPENTKKAKVLWPAVAKLARNNAYWAIPDLMELASLDSISNSKFKTKINDLLYDGLVLCGNSQLEETDFEAAVSSLSEAISIKPTAELLENRAQAYDDLDKAKLAAKDRKAAAKLDLSQK